MSTMTTDAPTAVREQRVAYVSTDATPARPQSTCRSPQAPTLWRCDVATYEKIIAAGSYSTRSTVN